jgi:CHAD domain-containing protein
MAFRFKLQEPLAQEVRRVALEQIDLAEEKLTSEHDIPDAIHNARRGLKRLRALIRLLRPAIGDTAYRRESERIAGTARLLAGARDVHVMRLTATKLESRFGPLPGGAGKRLNAFLAKEAAAIPSDAKDGRAQALKRLKQTRKFFTGPALDDLSFAALAEGLERCYRKGRRGFRDAFRKPSDESFHAWRKSVQRHWRHMQLIGRAWPEALSARADEAKELSRLLGEDHDLAVLLAKITDAAPDLTRDDMAAIGSLCRSWQTEIRGLAEPRGARLFAEPAEELRRRIEAYWSSAGRLVECAGPEERPPPRRKPAAAGRRTRRRKTPPAA